MGFENIQSVFKHPIIGAIWETHVVMQVHKYFHAQGKNIPLWFWRTVHGAETDLIIEQGGRFTAIEIKFSENPDAKALKGINALVKMYGEKCLITGFVASRTKHVYPLSELVNVVPGSDIDLYLSHEYQSA